MAGMDIPNGTLVHRILLLGHSPLSSSFYKHNITQQDYNNDCGFVDTAKYLLFHENFVKQYSEEHLLLTLLTKSF